MDNLPTESTTEVAGSDFDIVSAALFGDEPEETGSEGVTNDSDNQTIVEEENENPTDEVEVNQDVSPAIEAPKSWSAEEKAAFNLLPLEVQKSLSEREAKRTGDISRQFNEVNEQKKVVEAERQQVLAQRAQYVQALETQTNFIQLELGKKYGNIDFVKLSTDQPDVAVRVQAEYARDKAELENAYMNLQNAKQLQAQDATKAYKEYLAEQNERLNSFIPEWKDEGKRKAIKSDMVNYLVNTYNFSQTELNSLVDAREASIAYKAYMYDKGMKEAQSKKVSNAPKVQSATVNQSQGRTGSEQGLNNKAKQVLRGTNNTRAQASIIAGLLD